MANATVGTAIVKLSFDGKGVTAELDGVSKKIETAGSSSGSKFGDAWTIAAGNLIAKGVAKIASVIESNLGNAIQRVDTINNFPKMMSNMGISADASQASIDKLSEKLQGLPTSLNAGVSAVARFTSKNSDVQKSTDLFLALNNAILAGGAPLDLQTTALEQLSQAYAKGKPDMMEWRSAMSAMPAQLNQVAKAMGLGDNAAQALGEGLRDGSISMDDFMAQIVKLNTEGVDGFQNFEEQARNSTGGIQTALANVQNRIAAMIGKIINRLGAEDISAAINAFSSSLSSIADVVINIIDFLSANWGWIEPILAGVLTFATSLLAMGFASKVINFLKTTAALLTAHPVVTIISAVATGAMLIIRYWEPIKNFFIGIWDGIKSGAEAAWNFITSIFSNVAEFFGSIFGAAWERVKAVFSTGGQIFMGIVDGVTEAFRNIVNTIIRGINFVVAIPFNAINGFLSFLKGIDILGLKPFDWVGTIDVPQIPLLAQGGVATGATQAIIGEAGQEVVLPLENNTDNWAGLLASTLVQEMEIENLGVSSGVTIEKQEFIINNQLDAEDIGRVMMQSIRRAA